MLATAWTKSNRVLNVCSLTVQRLGVGQVFLELFVQVFTDSDVLEHSLQFGRVLEPARLLRENKNRASVSVKVVAAGALLWMSVTRRRGESHLEFGDHAGLCVVAGAVLVDQTFGEHLGIKLLENIFVLDVLEHNHLKEERQRLTPVCAQYCLLHLPTQTSLTN